jgi:hypothetical protein
MGDLGRLMQARLRNRALIGLTARPFKQDRLEFVWIWLAR